MRAVLHCVIYTSSYFTVPCKYVCSKNCTLRGHQGLLRTQSYVMLLYLGLHINYRAKDGNMDVKWDICATTGEWSKSHISSQDPLVQLRQWCSLHETELFCENWHNQRFIFSLVNVQSQDITFSQSTGLQGFST